MQVERQAYPGLCSPIADFCISQTSEILAAKPRKMCLAEPRFAVRAMKPR
jgi:hypothetical protein